LPVPGRSTSTTSDHNPIWFQNNCSEDNRHVFIGNEHYVISGDDMLMPSKKDQARDLRYFQADAEVRRAFAQLLR